MEAHAMLDTQAPNLTESIRILFNDSDEKHHRMAAPAAAVVRSAPKRPAQHRQVQEKRTFQAMFTFGLLLGGLELFIVLHYL
jgi:hypothetical protein